MVNRCSTARSLLFTTFLDSILTTSIQAADPAPAEGRGIWSDIKEQIVLLIREEIDYFERVYDLDELVQDPFTLNPKTLEKFSRLPVSYRLYLAQFLAKEATHLYLQPANNDSNPAVVSLELDAEVGLEMGKKLVDSFGGAFNEYDLIDLSAYVMSKAPFFTPALWDRIKDTIEVVDLYIALGAALGSFAYRFFDDGINGSTSSWFLHSQNGKFRVGWYGKIWDLQWKERPGAAAGVRLSLGRVHTGLGMYLDGDPDAYDGQIGVHAELSESFLYPLLKPLGWMVQTSYRADHILKYKGSAQPDRLHSTEISAAISARKMPEFGTGGKNFLILNLVGTGDTLGAKSLRFGATSYRENVSLMANASVSQSSPEEDPSYSAMVGTRVRSGLHPGLQVTMGGMAMDSEIMPATYSVSGSLGDDETGATGSLRISVLPPARFGGMGEQATYTAGLFAAGTGRSALERSQKNLENSGLRTEEWFAKVQTDHLRIEALTRRILAGESIESHKLTAELYWLGYDRLQLRQRLDDYLQTSAKVELMLARMSARSRLTSGPSYRIGPEVLEQILAEAASETFNVEGTHFYQRGN